MKILVEIDRMDVETRTVNGRNGEFTITEQSLWMQMPNEKYPKRAKIQIGKDVQPYLEGVYLVDERSYYIDRYGFLQLRKTLILQPYEETTA